MKLSYATRISSAFPFAVKACKYKDELFIDGGCTDNYPFKRLILNLNPFIVLFSFVICYYEEYDYEYD